MRPVTPYTLRRKLLRIRDCGSVQREREVCSGRVSWPRWGVLRDCRYLLHDRDTKYTHSFRAIIESGHVKTLLLPARIPNLNAYAERWIRSARDECLSKLILFGERSLTRALSEYVRHYHAEGNHQGKDNVLLFPRLPVWYRARTVQCRERLGGLLRYYHHQAA
jgi:putative transposase